MSTPVYDLRPALTPFQRAWRPAGDEADGEPFVADPDAPEPPPADSDTGGRDKDGNPIKDPDKKRLSEEAAKHRRDARDAQSARDTATAALADARAELAGMAGLPDQVAALQRQNAFLIGAAGHINDLEAAWKLADHDTLVITDGAVTGADVAVAAVLERYPYLALGDEPFGDSGGFLPTGPQPSGRPANGKAVSGQGANRGVLHKKFPALRGR